jgi:DNA repair protein RadC
MLQELGSLARALGAEFTTLERLAGREAAAALCIAHEAAKRLAMEPIARRQCVTSWTQLTAFLKVALAARAREEFHVMFLDKKNQLLAFEHLTSGTVDHAPVYPREIMRRALELGASALILVHNHPSGDPTPSQADIAITREIKACAKVMGMSVHDHVIVGRDGLTSFKAQGLID